MSRSPSASNGIRSLKVNGPVYALNRTTGKLEWVCDFLPHQNLLLEQVQDLPILLFTAQYYKSANGMDRTMVKVTGVDKRTGKLVYDKEFVPSTQFHALRIDPRAGLIEFVAPMKFPVHLLAALEGLQKVLRLEGVGIQGGFRPQRACGDDELADLPAVEILLQRFYLFCCEAHHRTRTLRTGSGFERVTPFISAPSLSSLRSSCRFSLGVRGSQ